MNQKDFFDDIKINLILFLIDLLLIDYKLNIILIKLIFQINF